MKEQAQFFVNFLGTALTSLILVHAQSVIWYHLFGTTPAPMLWLLGIVYVALYRQGIESAALAYVLAMIAAAFTVKSPTLFVATSCLVFVAVTLFKSRIYWDGARYYAAVALGAAFFFHFIDIVFAYSFENYIFSTRHLVDRFLSAMLTTLGSLPVYGLYRISDALTFRSPFHDVGGQTR